MLIKRRAFVIMPFGEKELPARVGGTSDVQRVNFNDVYNLLIKPALQRAQCEPFRADEETSAQSILTDMFFELLTADIVVADESIPNPNVYYECGIRDAARKQGFIAIHGDWTSAPFDLASVRRFRYSGKLWLIGTQRSDTEVEMEIAKLANVFKRAIDAIDRADGSLFYQEMRGLVEPDWSKLESTRGKYFQTLSDDWQNRIALAEDKSLPGDILTLADEAPTRRDAKKLRFRAAYAMISIHRFDAACTLLKQLKIEKAMRPGEQAKLALTYARLGRLPEAINEAQELQTHDENDAEVAGNLGSVYKEIWRSEWGGIEELADRLKWAARTSTNASNSINSYHRGLWKNLNKYWLGINVLTMWRLLMHVGAASNEALDTPHIHDLDDLSALVRLSVIQALRDADTKPAKQRDKDRIWALATRGELALLDGKAADAIRDYRDAANTAGVNYYKIDSIRRQLQLMTLLDFQPEAVKRIIEELDSAARHFKGPREHYERVFVCSGHMTDLPAREHARFPEQKVEEVKVAIEGALDKWEIGPKDLAMCGGARGADILFAEACLRRGTRARMLIPLPEAEFVARSVAHPKANWSNRYHALKGSKLVEVWFQEEHLGPPRNPDDVWERNNRWIINTARTEAPPDPICALFVWDGKQSGDGKGGTSHFERLYREEAAGHDSVIIDPTTI